MGGLRQDPRWGADLCAVTSTSSAFELPDRLGAKRDPALIGLDDQHFTAVASALESSISELDERLTAERLAPAGHGQRALERDLEVHRLTARLRALRRFGLDACLGRMVMVGHPEPVYIGRFGLTDSDGRRLLVDWRSPAAEPFFGATHATPMGLSSRRRYRWTRGRITDYWDEVFTAEGLEGNAALDDQSAFIASLGGSRSARMRDVLGTIQADQDAIIRAGSHGALVVDGGPGTGKTVVALHRAAYLLYSDSRIARASNGLLFVGPSAAYLSYVDDVLPSLGEFSAQVCTLRDLVPEGIAAVPEPDAAVASIKSTARMVAAIETAVRMLQQPPATAVTVETPWADVRISAEQWAEAFDAAEPGAPHNEAREQVFGALVEILVDSLTEQERERDGDERSDEFDAYGGGRDDPHDTVRRALAGDGEVQRAVDRAWPAIDGPALVARLWSNPDLLRRCAPWLTVSEASSLQRSEPRAWTTADLPLLDAARQLLGDPEAARRNRLRDASVAAERARMAEVVDDLIASDDSELGIMSMLRGQDLRATLVDDAARPSTSLDELAGPFAHIVVDEAQELTDAEWQMVLLRCPSRSFTIVGDRAQARHGFGESWQQRLTRVGLDRVTVASLSINYRTPEEVMAEAEPVIRAALPDANVPTSVRRSERPVVHGRVSQLRAILEEWLTTHDEGIAAVIGPSDLAAMPRVRVLTAEGSKGLEFDLVIVVDPESFGRGIEGAVDRYVAMTRATQQLVILTSGYQA